MDKLTPEIWEGDDYYSIPEEILKQLPAEIRAPYEEIMKQGHEMCSLVEKEIESLIRLIKAIPTTSSLSYIYHRLRTSKFEVTSEDFMEHEMLTTAFVVTYARLFGKSNGVCILKRNDLPAHLRGIHDELYKIRNERYAHNGGHESIDTLVGFTFSGTTVHINTKMSLGMYLCGRNEWGDLVTYLDALMHERLSKICKRLTDKTGCEWIFPTGPVPSWIGKYGK